MRFTLEAPPRVAMAVLSSVLTMEEFSLDTPRNRLWSYRLSGSTSSCHDGSMLSKGGAVEKPSLNASPTHTQPRFAGVLHESITT